MRRPCFEEDDVGLACITSKEARSPNSNNTPFFSRARKSSSYRSLSSLSSSSCSSSSSPRSTRFYDTKCREQQLPHFLEACFLCKKPLGENRDIFMYRGDTPFCSEECRDEQIEIDEEKERNLKFASSMKTIRKDKQTKSPTNKSQNYHVRTSTVAAA
ncbi:hypothetical protein IFM89_016791 [Coptis chinensis]|uniref:FLZ-type domain-containing protein n=1 Tax=Coptis chinensis TaxID=261450 RepID=A0A835MIH7_9MAGN|nr:hypothetical protein IFM89_016791 [Coptis chinensis]